ncbi:DUF6509 family protein [Bacillus dakarensis]|uniref:DUF6509 family protein n=1 Tax=Robertmurraya dakarensis TaxID=1926278 RepID=UPI0009824A60|nr:DUF6509 family protein [Bacillus dakarensis]
MEITDHSLERLEDPFGILTGDRYEYFLHINVDEEDELYTENGLQIKVLYVVDEKGKRISHYNIIENTTEKVLDFELEEDELELIEAYCREHLQEEE